MTQAGDKPARQPVLHTDEERAQIERFIKAINQAMVVNGLSQRGLCELIGVNEAEARIVRLGGISMGDGCPRLVIESRPGSPGNCVGPGWIERVWKRAE